MKRRFTIENEGAVYEASVAAFVSRPLVSLLARTEIVLVATVVLAAVGWQWVLGGMIRVPTIFGDELIYWEMSRAFAATGHFAVRGGGHPGYGIGYPALISVAHLLSPTETGAYVVGRVINSALFSLAAIPAYSIARRVLSRNAAIFAALLAVFVPSSIYTRTIMTENAFYPAFLVTVLAMLRASEAPTRARQLVLVVACAVLVLIRAQAIVALPAFVVAAVAIARVEMGSWRTAVRYVNRTYITLLAVVALGAALAAVRGGAVLGAYHVLLRAYSPLSFTRWALANVADIELYVGVLPFCAFLLCLIGVFANPSSQPAPLRRLVILTASLGAGLCATVAVLSSSEYGLGRVHERNLFCIAPLILTTFLAWATGGLRRPRRPALAAAAIVGALPLAIPAGAIRKSNIDALALVWWHVTRLPWPFITLAMAAFATAGAIIFLRARQPATAIYSSAAVIVLTILGAQLISAADAKPYAQGRADAGWIDQAVGAGSDVATIITARSTRNLSAASTRDLWMDEFFNRSVHDVLSIGGPLPDGLPVHRLTLDADGCLSGLTTDRYAVALAEEPLDAPIVARDPHTRSILYRLSGKRDRACLAGAR